MSGTKFIVSLSHLEHEWLSTIESSTSESKRTRARAQAIRLSSSGFCIQQITEICQATRKTVSKWLDDWERQGFDSLLESPRSGRPKILSEQEEQQAIELVKESPRQSKQAFVKMQEKSGKTFCFRTFKRVLKKTSLEKSSHIDPQLKEVRVFRDERHSTIYLLNDECDASPVLHDFRIIIEQLFE